MSLPPEQGFALTLFGDWHIGYIFGRDRGVVLFLVILFLLLIGLYIFALILFSSSKSSSRPLVVEGTNQLTSHLYTLLGTGPFGLL